MKILSITRQTIKQFGKSNYNNDRNDRNDRPVLVFHCEFENEYNGKTDDFYLFACVFYDDKPLLYRLSKDGDCNSVWDGVISCLTQ